MTDKFRKVDTSLTIFIVRDKPIFREGNNGLRKKSQTSVILLACFLITLGVPCFATGIPPKAFDYMQYKNFLKALEMLQASLKEQPNDWQILQAVGNCNMQLGRYKLAIPFLTKSIESGGLHPSQCTIMAAALEGLGQPKQALSWLLLSCRIDPRQASNVNMQRAIQRLEDPTNNPSGLINAPNYISGLVSVNRWRKEDMPLKVYVRKNVQLPEFYDAFFGIVKYSLDQWCQATSGKISYIFVQNQDAAKIIWDYTENPELCSSNHELGVDGDTELKLRTRDHAPETASVVILVKDNRNCSAFRSKSFITKTCLHECGHVLGLHGHSPNNKGRNVLGYNAERYYCVKSAR